MNLETGRRKIDGQLSDPLIFLVMILKLLKKGEKILRACLRTMAVDEIGGIYNRRGS